MRRIDHDKSAMVIEIDGEKYNLFVSDNYGLVLDGGEGRIRTYERARRADLQSAAFGHSATSPEPLVEEYDIRKKKKQ